ncbi:DEAD/DEAH box helicase [Rhizosaccharibacter radicis]|uniref:Transcription-repair-coupling factor n=1 Tax=Rhizosaccharibacter radicis TaxID=2782605 RepID=A0ABT1VVU3_9PROT|nr:DEAD/DEAH box helicase [Acetobacteraceae bacterium KSS12]
MAIALVERRGEQDAIHVARSEERARRVALLAQALAPERAVELLPGWDCLFYDRTGPSATCMGARMAVASRLERPRDAFALLILSVDAASQRLPAELVSSLDWTVGGDIDIDGIVPTLVRRGFKRRDLAEAPGDFALRGDILDVFPPDHERDRCTAWRVEHHEGRIISIRCFDPHSQRSGEEASALSIRAASELVLPDDRDPIRPPGIELLLGQNGERLRTAFDLLPGAAISHDRAVPARRTEIGEELHDGFAARLSASRGVSDIPAPAPPSVLYLDDAAWTLATGSRLWPLASASGAAPANDDGATASFPRDEEAAFDFAESRARDGSVLLMLTPSLMRAAERRFRRNGRQDVRPVDGWISFRREPPAIGLLPVPAAPASWPAGWAADRFCVMTPTAFGHDGEGGVVAAAADPLEGMVDAGLRCGDAVVHWEHGVGLLQGLQTVDGGAGVVDCLRVGFARDGALLVPFDEIDELWRYGGEGSGVALDHLNTDAWKTRRTEIAEQIVTAGRELAALVAEREGRSAPLLRAGRRQGRFDRGFPHPLTPDQDRALADVLADLASGRPMDRLLCGDVGFGKTEIAVRAAGVAALAGYQVAVLAPTTVLARQHLQTFRERFQPFGIAVEGLSRLTPPAEARRIKRGLASGEVRVVIGTQALAAPDVRFDRLGFVVVDEEQRFGTRQKTMLRRLVACDAGTECVHLLTMTATPIPRTLQTALVGLQELSVLATPPARRQPVRTELMPFDELVLREALMREHRRGGRSFVVCPRIEDIAPMRDRLRALVPDLTQAEAHGAMAPDAVDDAMLRFADGQADILLSTNIVETGLDVRNADTMVIWHAERFGLSQLHQLRGRVGRGRARGAAFLMTDPGDPPGPAALKRLQCLADLDRVGAGFAVSARDLDLRGAGDLLGDTQAGHVRLIGLELYQHLLRHSLAAARGRDLRPMRPISLSVPGDAFIPVEYVPDENLRVELLSRLARLSRRGGTARLDGFAAELEDRFGSVPEPLSRLLALCRLRIRARRRGVSRIEAGPDAVAASFHDAPPGGLHPELERAGDRVLLRRPASGGDAMLHHAELLLDRLPTEERARPPRSRRRAEPAPVGEAARAA